MQKVSLYSQQSLFRKKPVHKTPCLERTFFCVSEDCVFICHAECEVGCRLGSILKVFWLIFPSGIDENLREIHVAQLLLFLRQMLIKTNSYLEGYPFSKLVTSRGSDVKEQSLGSSETKL